MNWIKSILVIIELILRWFFNKGTRQKEKAINAYKNISQGRELRRHLRISRSALNKSVDELLERDKDTK